LKDSDCLDCHGDNTLWVTNAAGKAVSLFVDKAKLAASVHGTNSCISCHADVSGKHPDDNVELQRVVCANCHAREGASYEASVHGLALLAGHTKAARCEDCHDSHGIISDSSPTSPMFFSRQAETCGKCHLQETRDWGLSVHGQAVAAGKRGAPTCTDCHSEHRIESLKGSLKISEQVCSRCHASERLNTEFNLPGDRVKTFFESYHGLAGRYGSTVAANCASCHGFHGILPSTDTNSTINQAHLVETCGKCHPGDSEKFAFGKVHIAADGASLDGGMGSRINRVVREFYLTLIGVVVGAMLAHNLILFLKKTAGRLRSSVRPVVRMSGGQRWQHWLLAGSFMVLAVTGFALKFPDSWLAKALGANEPLRRWCHRGAGIVLLMTALWHLAYLMVSPEGRQLLRDLLPVRRDLGEAWQMVRYLGGRRKDRPSAGRFGYGEKLEYWAVVWGVMIMGGTGFMIWFPIALTQWVPRWLVEVALTIHYYEAVLACLAIVVWHFYQVIFDPDVYPVNPACLDGRVAKEGEGHPKRP
jgi:formate dehydrogenase gamma subunit